MKHVINAYDIGAENHGLNTSFSTLIIQAPDDMSSEDVLEAMKKASIDYCCTEEGKETFHHNCKNFNIGDFDLHVPNTICLKYGIQKITNDDITVDTIDFNTQLVTESDIEDK